MRSVPLLSLVLALAACGGGGSSLPGPTVPTTPTGGTAPQSVTLSIAIPGSAGTAADRARRPLYVSTNTGSASISVNGGTASITNISAGSPNCTPLSGGGRSCTLTVSAPAGNDTFAIALFASTDGSGPALSKNTITTTITAGIANSVKAVLNGVVASIALALKTSTPPAGTPATIPLTVTFKDASGATIVGSDAFTSPVTLTDSDGSGATKITPSTTVNSPADAASLNVTYNGSSTLTSAVFGASAPGVPAASVTTATLTPQASTVNPSAFVDWPTYAYDSGRTGFNPYSTGLTPASVSKLHLAWQISTGGVAQTQPVVATNVAGHSAIVIVGGYPTVIAYDALNGSQVWKTTVGTQNYQDCGTSGIGGTVQYDAALGAVFVTAGNYGASPNHVVLYRLDVKTGAITSSVDVTPTLLPGEAVAAHTAITMANGLLYLGTGSNCEGTSTGLTSWRGRVVAVDPASMTVRGTFFPTYGQGGKNYGGGGIWSWGGVSADPSGNIYIGTGNAESDGTVNQIPQPPFDRTKDETVAFGDHLVKVSGDLTTVKDSNYPTFNFFIGILDLDYAGTPVIYQPPIGSGCGTLAATQGKGGELVINNTQQLSPALNVFKFSVPSAEAFYIGNPTYSPSTGYLYAPITSSGNGSSMMAPGLAAISGCGSTLAWHAQFGPDSAAYPSEVPRSAPTVTAGGVVLQGTPCTPDGNGGCGAPSSTIKGALWAIDATTSDVLGGGKPVLQTNSHIRMPPTVDGLWTYVLDQGGNLYAMTVDPAVKAIAAKSGERAMQTFRYRSR